MSALGEWERGEREGRERALALGGGGGGGGVTEREGKRQRKERESERERNLTVSKDAFFPFLYYRVFTWESSLPLALVQLGCCLL